jgi:hypothetical protein
MVACDHRAISTCNDRFPLTEPFIGPGYRLDVALTWVSVQEAQSLDGLGEWLKVGSNHCPQGICGHLGTSSFGWA